MAMQSATPTPTSPTPKPDAGPTKKLKQKPQKKPSNTLDRWFKPQSSTVAKKPKESQETHDKPKPKKKPAVGASKTFVQRYKKCYEVKEQPEGDWRCRRCQFVVEETSWEDISSAVDGQVKTAEDVVFPKLQGLPEDHRFKELHKDCDFAAVFLFLQRFRRLGLNISNTVTLENLANAMLAPRDPLCEELHTRLLSNVNATMSKKHTWNVNLLRFLRDAEYPPAIAADTTFPSAKAEEEKLDGYYFDVSVKERVAMLKFLCEIQFDRNDSLVELIGDEDADSMRNDPIGTDAADRSYFVLEDAATVPDGSVWVCRCAKVGGSDWETVCDSLESVESLVEELSLSASTADLQLWKALSGGALKKLTRQLAKLKRQARYQEELSSRMTQAALYDGIGRRSLRSRREVNYADIDAEEEEEEEESEDSGEEEEAFEAKSSDDEVVIALGFSVLPPGCSDEVLYSYLLDFGHMKLSSSTEILDAFEIVHNTVIDYIVSCSNKSTVPYNYLLKMYYTCRHNVFAFLCSESDIEREIGTDASLSQYIDSSRTPDLIHEDETSIVLMEFTVANRYDMVDFNKGGGIVDVKYTKEAELVTKATGKRCRVMIVPAVLDEYNIKEVCDLMSPFYEVDEQLMTRFFSVANGSKSYISNAYFSGSSSSKGISTVPGVNDMPVLNSTEMLDSHFVSIVLKNWSWLSNFVAGILDRRGPDYTIAFIYEKSTGRIKMVEQPKKIKSLKIGECLEILRDGDLSKVLSKMNYRSEGKEITSKEMRGDVALTTAGYKKTFKAKKWKYSTTTKDVYNFTSANFVDSYTESRTLPPSEGAHSTQKVLFDDNYFNQLMNSQFENLMNTNSTSLLSNNVITEEYLKEVSTMYKAKYKEVNMDINQNFNPKQSFLLPIVSVPCVSTDLENLKLPVLNSYLASGSGNYTKAILTKVLSGNFHHRAVDDESIVKMREKYSKLRNAYTTLLFKQDLKGLKKWSMLPSGVKSVLHTPRSRMVSAQQEYASLLRAAKQKKIRTVKLNCGKNSIMKREFKREMLHFQKESKGRRGVGEIRDPNELDKFFKQFVNSMNDVNFQKMNLPPLYNSERSPGPEFLNKDKEFYTERWDKFYKEHFKGTLLEQLTVIGTNFSKLLFNESVKTYNQNYCRIDNLGTEQVIVLIRGGKKAYSRNMSKLFRVGFECNPDHLKYMGYLENKFFEVIKTNGQTFVYTPWSQIHLDILYDWFSMRYRAFLNVYSNHVREGGIGPVSSLSLFPTVLSFHNRRKTEQLLHNTRYLIVNPMGKYANLKGIIEGFCTYNHSYFDAWIKECLKLRYEKFSIGVFKASRNGSSRLDDMLTKSEIKDIWFGTPFTGSDQLTNFIYITYAMTKAPVNASLEQASNLKSILEDIDEFDRIHGDVVNMNDSSLHMDVMNFKPSDYDDDYKYDPKFCQFLGYHIAGFLKTRADPNEMNKLWNKANSRGLGSIANSNGLRGFNSGNFYGKKGYEVVFDFIIQKLESNDIELNDLVEQYISLDLEGAQHAISSDKITKQELTLDQITYHIVHKIQRGGGREIFCMDLVTKAYQNPLEQFFKGVCKMIPNEFISISANKRHSIIHTDFFERTPAPWIKSTLRWVLDCRRWAPHSVFQKYMHFVHGMSPVLPAEMVADFEQFGTLMMNKRYITREHVYNSIKNNERYAALRGLMKPAKEAGTYEMGVKFSFVMGIFNYLSSLMHAANQMLSSEIIMNYNLKSGNGLVIMDPKCHSDDSAITSYHENPASIKPSVTLYDWLLKAGNHMLSVKKSQVNENIYMEFLSILYLFDRYVPVIPKFVSSIPFKPTDGGYSSDVTFSVTQAIEVLMNGGTIEESFLILKLTEKHIQAIYNLPSNNKQPFNFLGNIDAHPIELLLAGAQCEIYKHMRYTPINFWSTVSVLSEMNLIDPTSPTDVSVKWDMSSRMSRSLKKKYEKYTGVADNISRKYPWTLENCKLGNEYLNIIWFVNKLSDPKYYSSLVHEPESRRFTRAFGSYKYRNVMSSSGELIPVLKLAAILSQVDLYSGKVSSEKRKSLTEILNFSCDDLSSFYQAVESAKWLGDEKPCGFKDKPVYFNFSLPQLSNVRIDANEYISYEREPEAYKLLGKRSNPARQVQQINDYCQSLGLDTVNYTDSQLYMVVNRILNAGEHNFRLIAPMPSQHKKMDTFNSILVYLEHNSIRHKIRTVISTSTSRVDWKRRVINGRVPEAVLDAMEVQSVIEIADKFKVLDSDIFLTDLNHKLQEARDETPTSWKPLLSASLSAHDKPLINENYWVYWAKDQVKSGRDWYGAGVLYVCLPEAKMRIKVNNGIISELAVDSEESIMFNTTTNWYLGNLFRMSGMNLPMDQSQYQDPNCLVFGYHSKSASYGIDYPNRFDLVFINPLIITETTSSFMYVNCEKRRKGRYWMYDDGKKEYKIEFFVPTAEVPVIDLSKYVDKKKVKEMLTNKKIRDFCFNLSIEMREEYTFKTEDVVNTIGYSLIYKLLYSHPDFLKMYRGEEVNDVFLESIIGWKKSHPEFEFPDNEQIAEMAKRSDLPQMPGRIQRYLNKLGISSISDDDFTAMISHLYSINEDDRMSYLLSMFPMLSQEEQIQTLTIATRSERIYESAGFLGKDAFRLLNPIVSAIREVIETNSCFSQTLTSITTRFSRGTGSDLYTFDMIIARVVLTGLTCLEMKSESDQTVGLLMSILDELIEDGLLVALEIRTVSVPLLNSIKFNVTREKFIDLMMNILDAIYIGRWLKIKNIKRKDLIRLDSADFSPYKKHMLKILEWKMPETIDLNFKKKSKRFHVRLGLEKGTPGLPTGVFRPLGEMDQEEYNDGFVWNEDIEEDLELEEFGEVKQMGYVRVESGNWKGMCSVRGTAHTVFIGTYTLSRDMLQAHGDKSIYRKERYTTLNDYINNFGFYILKISESKKNINISGYTKMNYTDYFKSESSYKSPKALINGKYYDKMTVVSSPKLARELSGLDSYFKRMSVDNANLEVKAVDKKMEGMKEIGVELDPLYIETREKVDRLINPEKFLPKPKKKQRRKKTGKESSNSGEGDDDTEEPQWGVDLNDILSGEQIMEQIEKLIEHSNKGFSLPATKRRISSERNVTYKEPMQLLRDPTLIGEFNSLFGNEWNRFEQNSLRLTALTKRTKLNYMKFRVKAMPASMQPNYAKLMGVVACLLSDIETCQSIQHETHELSSAIDSLFDVDMQIMDERDLTMFLEPSAGEIRRDPDLDKLFP
uniref:RNA-directed RNA polymerase L n=1 Tax=Phytophthora palustris bunya-like virus 8 TaxID=2976287 RepID=A0A9E8Z105_9VIRU|nr:RNA-dependent RNA polymerase [Phytophthora palustris bunya-like virus 8]